MKKGELKNGYTYIATDLDGNHHYATMVNGIVYCCYPAYTMDGRENKLVDYKSIPESELDVQ